MYKKDYNKLHDNKLNLVKLSLLNNINERICDQA